MYAPKVIDVITPTAILLLKKITLQMLHGKRQETTRFENEACLYTIYINFQQYALRINRV